MIGHKKGVTTSLSTFSAPVGVQEMSLSTQQSLSSVSAVSQQSLSSLLAISWHSLDSLLAIFQQSYCRSTKNFSIEYISPPKYIFKTGSMNSNLQLCFNQIKYALFTFHLEQRQHTWTTPFSMDLQYLNVYTFISSSLFTQCFTT